MSQTAKIGFIGLGNMGKPMAINAVRSGFDLIAFDINTTPLKELAVAGARIARSANEVGAYADIIAVVVVDDLQVEKLTMGEGGVLETARKGSVIAIHSTVHAETVLKIASAAAMRGVAVIDAQVSGGPAGAAEKSLCYMVGGDKGALEYCRPVFETSGINILHLGALGSGATAKLAHNLIVYLNRLAVSEGMRLAEKAGLDLVAFSQAVHFGNAQSRAADNWLQRAERVGDRNTSPNRLPAIIYKDLKLALELANKLGLPLPGAALAQQLIKDIV